MGAMKMVRTAMTNGGRATTASEQEAWNSVIAREQRRREFYAQRPQTDGDSCIEPVYLRTDYVGWLPTETGVYVVVDLTSNRRMVVDVFESSNVLKVTNLDFPHNPATDLAIFGQRYYRWFRLSTLDKEDINEIKSLPVVKEAPASTPVPPILEAEAQVTNGTD